MLVRGYRTVWCAALGAAWTLMSCGSRGGVAIKEKQDGGPALVDAQPTLDDADSDDRVDLPADRSHDGLAAFTVVEFPIPTANSMALDIAPGPDGNVWFTENYGNNIGRITPAGVITEFAVPTATGQPSGIAPGSDGNVWFSEALGNKIGRITPTGTITEFDLPHANSRP